MEKGILLPAQYGICMGNVVIHWRSQDLDVGEHLMGIDGGLPPHPEKGLERGCAPFSEFVFDFHARKQLLLSARLSHRNSVRLFVCLSVCMSVCLSVCHTGGSVKSGAS